MKKITYKKATPQKSSKSQDLQQERVIKGFAELLSTLGITVRREELKRGLGWRAQSGKCKIQESNLLFVDRRSLLSEQAAVLSQAILEHKSKINDDMISMLNSDAAEKVRTLVS